MTASEIPAHALLPLALLLAGGAVLAASMAFRLPRRTQRRAGWLAVGAPLIPAVRPHLAHDGADLAALVLASVLLFAAVMHAQRTWVAQLPLFWEWQVDRAAGHLPPDRPEFKGPFSASHHDRRRGWDRLRRWTRG